MNNYHASIWLKKSENKYIGVYLHLFPEMFHCGYILLTEYTNKAKVEELLSFGDIYELRECINETDSNSKYNTIFYHRDKGDRKKIFTTNSEQATNKFEYSYLFKNNKWYICLKEDYQELSIELIEDEIESPIIFKKY